MSKTAKPAAVPREQEWLNGAERADLRAHEGTLDRGAQADIDRGKALADIRDRRLYRESHDTFETFCGQPRWRLSRAQAYRLIDLAGIVATVSPTGDTPAPTSERVARELAPLREQPEAMQEAWAEAVEQHGPAPTAAQVREVVRGPEPPGDDLRFARIEDAAGILEALPAPERLAWPTEEGDVDAVDAAMKLIADWYRRAAPAWKTHKADLKAQARTLRAVA